MNAWDYPYFTGAEDGLDLADASLAADDAASVADAAAATAQATAAQQAALLQQQQLAAQRAALAEQQAELSMLPATPIYHRHHVWRRLNGTTFRTRIGTPQDFHAQRLAARGHVVRVAGQSFVGAGGGSLFTVIAPEGATLRWQDGSEQDDGSGMGIAKGLQPGTTFQGTPCPHGLVEVTSPDHAGWVNAADVQEATATVTGAGFPGDLQFRVVNPHGAVMRWRDSSLMTNAHPIPVGTLVYGTPRGDGYIVEISSGGINGWVSTFDLEQLTSPPPAPVLATPPYVTHGTGADAASLTAHICPPGTYWDDYYGKCLPAHIPLTSPVVPHVAGADASLTGHICPPGTYWDDYYGKCLPAHIPLVPSPLPPTLADWHAQHATSGQWDDNYYSGAPVAHRGAQRRPTRESTTQHRPTRASSQPHRTRDSSVQHRPPIATSGEFAGWDAWGWPPGAFDIPGYYVGGGFSPEQIVVVQEGAPMYASDEFGAPMIGHAGASGQARIVGGNQPRRLYRVVDVDHPTSKPVWVAEEYLHADGGQFVGAEATPPTQPTAQHPAVPAQNHPVDHAAAHASDAAAHAAQAQQAAQHPAANRYASSATEHATQAAAHAQMAQHEPHHEHAHGHAQRAAEHAHLAERHSRYAHEAARRGFEHRGEHRGFERSRLGFGVRRRGFGRVGRFVHAHPEWHHYGHPAWRHGVHPHFAHHRAECVRTASGFFGRLFGGRRARHCHIERIHHPEGYITYRLTPAGAQEGIVLDGGMVQANQQYTVQTQQAAPTEDDGPMPGSDAASNGAEPEEKKDDTAAADDTADTAAADDAGADAAVDASDDTTATADAGDDAAATDAAVTGYYAGWEPEYGHPVYPQHPHHHRMHQQQQLEEELAVAQQQPYPLPHPHHHHHHPQAQQQGFDDAQFDEGLGAQPMYPPVYPHEHMREHMQRGFERGGYGHEHPYGGGGWGAQWHRGGWR